MDEEVLWPTDEAWGSQARTQLPIPAATDIGVARHATDRLLALIFVAAKQEIGDSLLSDDVGDVVGVDHQRSEFEIQFLGKRQGVELLDEQWDVLVAEGLADLHDQLTAAPQGWRAVGVGLLARLQPGRARMAASPSIRAHIRRPAEASNARGGHGGGIPLQVDLQGGADEHVASVEPGDLAERAARTQPAIGALEVDARSRPDVVVHPHFRSDTL